MIEARCHRERPTVSGLERLLTANGGIDTRTDALNADLTNFTKQQPSLVNYQMQFTALNTRMASMNGNSPYLMQFFGGANSAGVLFGSKS